METERRSRSTSSLPHLLSSASSSVSRPWPISEWLFERGRENSSSTVDRFVEVASLRVKLGRREREETHRGLRRE